MWLAGVMGTAVTDKLGFVTIAATVSITTAKEAEIITNSEAWGMGDYALLISMIGGGLFIIVKVMEGIERAISIKNKSKESE